MTFSCDSFIAPPCKYRPDIDGLRALAILPVLLFHADLGCTGGFVGVDVFFVISGFLITSLILKEINSDAFSLIRFWERRIRRIIPALIVVIAVTLLAGWFLYLPEDFCSVGKSVMAQVTLMSNVYFWRLTGYFAAGVDTKPLLHTWSLAVEEQFYVFFPLLLIFLARMKRFSFAKTIFWLGIGSFVLSVIGSYTKPAATFYLLPTRAWELMIGAFLAAIPEKQVSNPWLNETVGLTGRGLILFSILYYSQDTRFPGLAAIPPCFGAAMIIVSGSGKSTLIGRVLTLRPIVFIGLISYPLYLWHWPLLVFSKYLAIKPQSTEIRVVLLMVSAALATLSWKYIETPFRKRRIFHERRPLFIMTGSSVAVLLVAGLWVYYYNGLPSRLSAKIRSYADSRNQSAFNNNRSLDDAMAGRFIEFGSKETNQPVTVLIWGDSHAMAITSILDDLCQRFSCRGIEAAHTSTAPVLDYVSTGPASFREESPAFNNAVLRFIAQKHINSVILAAYWPGYPATDSFKTGLVSTVHTLLNLGVHVYVLKDVPFPGFNAPRFVAITAMYNGDLNKLGLSPEQYRVRNRQFEETFVQIARMGATVLNPLDYFLNQNGVYGVVHHDELLYYDGQHLSEEGARLLAPLFGPIFHANKKTTRQ